MRQRFEPAAITLLRDDLGTVTPICAPTDLPREEIMAMLSAVLSSLTPPPSTPAEMVMLDPEALPVEGEDTPSA